MRPQRRCFIPGSVSRVNSTTLKSRLFTASFQFSRVRDSNVPAGGPPVFVTRMSICPKRSMPLLTILFDIGEL
jgi:hypothetical protein